MKPITILLLILCSLSSVHSQDLVKEIQTLTLANDSLQKQIILPLQDSLSRLNTFHSAELSLLQSQIKALENDKTDLNKKINNLEKSNADLNKNKIKIERDDFQKQVTQLTAKLTELNLTIQEKDRQIVEEKRIGDQKANKKKENGKNEAMADIINSYKSKTFNELIEISTIQTVRRDRLLIGNDDEVKQIFDDLEKYFNAEELIAKKIDVELIKNAKIQLNEIVQQSVLLDNLKKNIEYYKDFSDELKKTIEVLIDLDRRKVADNDPEIQKLKFNELVSELANYLYNYYDYGNYPYLSDIILEIIKRKKLNADADILDLLSKI
jgi:DNA repair exonuclease SbcCD ATPase subunit